MSRYEDRGGPKEYRPSVGEPPAPGKQSAGTRDQRRRAALARGLLNSSIITTIVSKKQMEENRKEARRRFLATNGRYIGPDNAKTGPDFDTFKARAFALKLRELGQKKTKSRD